MIRSYTVTHAGEGAQILATLGIKRSGLAKLRANTGITTDRELAHRIGISNSQLARVIAGTSLPGNDTIAGLLHLFGFAAVADLFEVHP